jgi:molybdopterin-guanine dinucleotide biosynthesis protein A
VDHPHRRIDIGEGALKVAGIILAGGGSLRMGGADKPLLPIAGEAMLAHVARRLSPQVDRLLLSANGDPERFAAFGVEVVPDEGVERRGPLAGILAGLERVATIDPSVTHLVSAAADTPFLPPDLVARLAEAIDAGTHIAIAESDGRAHPTFGLWPANVRGPLREFLQSGAKSKVTDFVMAQGGRTAHFGLVDGVDPFFNVNTPADLDLARRIAGEKP